MASERIAFKNFESTGNLWIRTIESGDLEMLREWRNTHRTVLFFKKMINPDQQRKWYQGYLKRRDDFMFMIINNDIPIGCVGVRKINGFWDVYNLIRGVISRETRTFMAEATLKVCSFAVQRQRLPVYGRPLTGNKSALKFSQRIGFEVIGEGVEQEDRFTLLEYKQPNK